MYKGSLKHNELYQPMGLAHQTSVPAGAFGCHSQHEQKHNWLKLTLKAINQGLCFLRVQENSHSERWGVLHIHVGG